MTGSQVQKWADTAMYRSEDMPEEARVGPAVTLLAMNADPLGQIAATSMMYEGKVVRSLANDVSDEQRVHYFEQIKKTHLKMPFESVNFHFMLEGVTRSFTHQLVRQRVAAYAQESLRFSVIEMDDMNDRVALPPSLVGLKEDDPRLVAWRTAVRDLGGSYSALVNAGIPAEDARGLLPHNITTRVHYLTNLRALQEHLGNRLCTQAQFEWRQVAVGIVKAIRDYAKINAGFGGLGLEGNNWQFEKLSEMFRPICYLTGKCEFKASFDRACSIRERVDANAAAGRGSDQWDEPMYGGEQGSGVPGKTWVEILPIRPAEWLMDHAAAREKT